LNLNYEEDISECEHDWNITTIFMEEDCDELSLKQYEYNININKYITEKMNESIDIINQLYDNLKNNFPDWKCEIAQCKDINYTYGNPMKLYFDGFDYVKS
jgi:hypothetical protein